MRLPELDIQTVEVTVNGLGTLQVYPFSAAQIAALQDAGSRLAPVIEAVKTSLRGYENVDEWVASMPADLVGELITAISGAAVDVAEKNSPTTAG